MDLFSQHQEAHVKNNNIRAIKKCISPKNTAFDRLRLKMIKELKN